MEQIGSWIAANLWVVPVAAVVLFALGFALSALLGKQRMSSAKNQAESILEDARREADTLKKESLLEAKDYLFKQKQELEKENKERRAEVQALEKKLSKREDQLERRNENLDKKERELHSREKNIEQQEQSIADRKKNIDSLYMEQKEELEKISGMSQEQAKQLLLEKVESEVRRDAAMIIKRVEQETREQARKRSRDILITTIQKVASDETAEACVSTIPLPSDEIKGRIIGREGRNIRAFEQITGINLIIDDTPEAVVLSGFDPIRREVARLTLERLIQDGRIHPGRIEELFEKTATEIDEIVVEAGEQIAFESDVHDLHPELIRLLGRLKYRTSYGQNVLLHAKEVAYIAGILAAEVGANVQVAKRAGLLHDLGKSIDWEMQGGHATIGAEHAKRYGESEAVVHAIAAHHEDIEPNSVEDIIIVIADAISASRPGSRRETLETYIKRLEKLEEVANAFEGVEKTFAIQAGREIRIIVKPDKVDDVLSAKLAYDISKKIEADVEYPGQIKVTVIRETRATEYAR
jgi:ribonucrease Y